MDDLRRQVAAVQNTANKARAEAAEAKAEAVKAQNEAAEAKTEAALARVEIAKAKSGVVVSTNPSVRPTVEAESADDNTGFGFGFAPPFDKIDGGSRRENEAKEDVRIKAFFRNPEKVCTRNMLSAFFEGSFGPPFSGGC